MEASVSPGSGVTGDCEPLEMWVLGTELGDSAGAECAPNHGGTSLLHKELVQSIKVSILWGGGKAMVLKDQTTKGQPACKTVKRCKQNMKTLLSSYQRHGGEWPTLAAGAEAFYW